MLPKTIWSKYLEGHVPVHQVIGGGRDGAEEGADGVVLCDEEGVHLPVVHVNLVKEGVAVLAPS